MQASRSYLHEQLEASDASSQKLLMQEAKSYFKLEFDYADLVNEKIQQSSFKKYFKNCKVQVQNKILFELDATMIA